MGFLDKLFGTRSQREIKKLKPLQDNYADLSKNKDYIDKVIKENAEKAAYFSNKTLRKVQKKVGFPERIR